MRQRHFDHPYPRLRILLWVSLIVFICVISLVILETIPWILPSGKTKYYLIPQSISTAPSPRILPSTSPSEINTNQPMTNPNILLFFTNPSIPLNDSSCDRVYAVERTINREDRTPDQVIRILTQGPLPEETADGYQTLIPADTRIRSVSIKESVATVNLEIFNQEDSECIQSAIKAQISKTLLQFPDIQSVVILVDGEPIGN